MERIELALAANGGAYSDALILTAASMARFASRDVALRFHVLDGGLDFDKLVSKVGGLHPHVEFDRIAVDEGRFSAFKEFHGSKMTYARLLLPDLLHSVDHVIYCDVDFLWMADVADLWRMRSDSVPLLGVCDGYEPTARFEGKWIIGHGHGYDFERYVCAGLCLLNLRLLRDEGFTRTALKFLKDNPSAPLNDQTALNVLLFNRIRLVDSRWQRFPRMLDPADFELPIVLHYAGEAPWKISHVTHMVTDAQLLWFRWRATVFGTTLWRSLRSTYSPRQIILRRLVFLAIMICPLTYACFALFMKCRGAGRFRERIAFGRFRRLMRALS